MKRRLVISMSLLGNLHCNNDEMHIRPTNYSNVTTIIVKLQTEFNLTIITDHQARDL